VDGIHYGSARYAVELVCARRVIRFVEAATPGGARPTTESQSATQFSPDRVSWYPLHDGIGPVTGQMDDAAAALVVDELTTDVEDTVDLSKYADRSDVSKPVKFMLGLSTACVVRKDMSSHPGRMKSRFRLVVAVARLVEPFCVWVR